jgi:hypothetical protein
MTIGHRLILLVTTALLLAAAGCQYAKPDANRPPEWALRGSGAFTVEKRILLAGVGEARGNGDPGALLATADKNAETALAKVTAEFVRQAAEDYMTAVHGVPKEALPNLDMAEVENILQLAVGFRFPSGKIDGGWLAPAGDCAYALCVLDVESIIAAVNSDVRVDEPLRSFVTAQAPLIHGKVARSLEDNPVLTKGIEESDL